MAVENIYEKLSQERKHLQAIGECPEWYTTAGYQLLREKYLFEAKTPKEQYMRIAKTAGKWMEGVEPPEDAETWTDAFFTLLWKGWLSPSTPVLANMGTDRALPVSCSGQYIADSIDSIYSARHETAMLTKNGFGTAADLSAIRPRGADIYGGGKSVGVLPVVKGFVEDMNYVSQGSQRRGAFASYLNIEHGDFEEVCTYLEQYPDGLNIGWIIQDSFEAKLNAGDKEALARYQHALKTKMVTGKGYFFFKDKANRKIPEMYKSLGLDIKAPQLCCEIMLHSSEDYTYTCVLSSMNLARYREWENTDAVFVATVFLDCVVSEFLEKSKGIPGLEKARAFTEKGRALGLGACGLHTLFQQEMLAFEGFEAHMLNSLIFKQLHDDSLAASEWLAKTFGEPEWCKGYGVRNTHRTAIAPTKSTALIMGGISEGINPDPAMTFTQLSAAGEVDRVNAPLLNLMKARGIYDNAHINEINAAYGSVQDVDWLSDEEKQVFKTAFEINQEAILRLASARQQRICQGQSLNLFFSANEDEAYISHIHKKAFEDQNILGLYYCYSKRGVVASKGECLACQ